MYLPMTRKKMTVMTWIVHYCEELLLTNSLILGHGGLKNAIVYSLRIKHDAKGWRSLRPWSPANPFTPTCPQILSQKSKRLKWSNWHTQLTSNVGLSSLDSLKSGATSKNRRTNSILTVEWPVLVLKSSSHGIHWSGKKKDNKCTASNISKLKMF